MFIEPYETWKQSGYDFLDYHTPKKQTKKQINFYKKQNYFQSLIH